MLALYRGLSAAAAPLIDALLARRLAAGKEDKARFGERLGRPGLARPAGSLIWVHAASVGESLSVLSLIVRLLEDYPALHVLVTTGTVTSAALMAERLPERAFHQFAPIDRVDCVRSFLGHWHPDLALWVESEFWPNLLTETKKRGTRLVLVNARISPRAFARWRFFSWAIKPMLGSFDLCLAQSETEAARLKALGAMRVASPGNLKFAAEPLPANEPERAKLAALVSARPRWLAASTHPGEEEIVGRVHMTLSRRYDRLLTVIVPRHPGRGRAVAQELRAMGAMVALRSAGENPLPSSSVYIADSMGELGLFYRLCPISFVGGSLIPHGGHNPIEPAQLDSAIVHGPYMQNFRDIAAKLARSNAAVKVMDEAELGQAIGRLLSDDLETGRLAHAARRVAEAKSAVMDQVLSELAPFLLALAGPRHAGA
jgi:3-deoxy-D-manno-octulosonic-acid transferase